MSIKDRLIQFVLRGKDELSPAAEKSEAALDSLRQEAEQLGQALDKAKEAQGLARALRQTERAVEQTERSLVQADLQIRELRDALNQTPDGAGLQQSLKEAEREARKLQRGLDTLRTSLGDQQQAAKAAGIDTENLGDEHQRLAGDTDKAKKALADNNTQLKAAQREQNAAARATAEHSSRIEAARESMSRGAKQVLAFAAAYISLNAAFNLVRGGLNLLRDGIRAVIADGSSNEQALAQLESALASTGNAAGLTAQQLLDMADEFRAASMLTTEQILAGQTRLLSYTDIVASEFPAAMQIVIDQQQRLGISVEQSAEIVGRALQSPSEAIATLGRQGFKFEAGQKSLLKQLEATGRKAEAQAIIMDMLTEAYGGAAAAARMNTFAGLWKTVADQFGDFAGRVAGSGVFDFVKGKLAELASNLDAMANDGRLDRLAQALSDAFVQGAEWVEGFIRQLAGVDFKRLTDDSAAWLSSFGTHLDDASARLKLFVAPFRTLFNGLTAGLSGFAALITSKMSEILGAVGRVAEYLPNMLGGEKLRAAVADARGVLDGLTEGFRKQVEQDGKDIAAAWNTTTETVKTKAAEQTAAVKQEADDQFEHIVQRVTDMNNALAQIDAAEGATQLKQLGEEMYKAYQRGDLSQQQFANGTALLQSKLRALGGTASTASGELDDLQSIMAGIGRAANEVDFNRLRSAMRKAYSDGKLSAEDFAKAQAELNDRVAQLKPAAESSTRAVKEQGEALAESTAAAGAGVRRLADDAEEASGGMNWFAEVLTRARTPLAELSEAALEAFDAMQGINSVDREIDTSSIDKTAESLRKAKEQALAFQGALDLEGSRASGLGRWMMETFVRSEQVKATFLEQKLALQSLMQSYESGSISTRQFAAQAASARRNLDLLDDSDLSGLESAIEAANQKMRQMGDSTRSTLEGLQMELLQLKGTEEEIEKARFASRRRELQAQHAEARQSGDGAAVANLQKALRTLNEIERESSQQRIQQAQQKAADEVAKAAPSAQPPQPAKIIRLETSRGQTVEVGLQRDTDETRLLGILESAGMRSRR